MAKVKYNYKYALCEIMVLKDRASGETDKRFVTLPHSVKVVNERTKSRLLKEINEGGYLCNGEEAIYLKSVSKGIKVMEADLAEFLKIAVESIKPETSENTETEVE